MRAKRAKHIRRIVAELIRRSSTRLPQATHEIIMRKRGPATLLKRQRHRRDQIAQMKLKMPWLTSEMAAQIIPRVEPEGPVVRCVGQRRAYQTAKRLYLEEKRTGGR